MHKIPYPIFSEKYTDFGFDSTLKSFTITNTGTGKLNYSLISSQAWITVSPNIGEITTKADTIKISINRNGLSEKKHVESIEITSHVGQDVIRDTISVLVNGIMDQDKNYYGIVTIGSQTWMSENINTGIMIWNGYTKPKNNDNVEKFCYDDKKVNCDIYGGLYSWREAMQYNPPDSAVTGTTQGICPIGWHIPTEPEWLTLINFLGGYSAAGGPLKETGTAHWLTPNEGATNESGFTALPGGILSYPDADTTTIRYYYNGNWGFFWTTRMRYSGGGKLPEFVEMHNNETTVGFYQDLIDYFNGSVRCIKDPPKK